jgi:hypothetical protein
MPGDAIVLWMHILASAAVIAIALLPVAQDWVTRGFDALCQLACARQHPACDQPGPAVVIDPAGRDR